MTKAESILSRLDDNDIVGATELLLEDILSRTKDLNSWDSPQYDTDRKIQEEIKLDSSRDSLLSYFGLEVLRDRYFLRTPKTIVESPQTFYARIATGVACSYSDTFENKVSFAQDLYDIMSKHWFSPATPVLINIGTSRGLPISCFLNSVEDSIEGIYNTYRENAFLAKGGGGIGTYWGDIRHQDSGLSTGGKSSGMIPFLKVMDSATLAVSQGGIRRGASSVYIDIWHPEIEEFISIRKPTGGDQDRRCLNLHHGVVMDDVFMNAVESREKYWLRCPHTGKNVKQVDAFALFKQIIKLRIETGEPYILYLDNVKKATPEHHVEKNLYAQQSNLCLTGDTRLVSSNGLLTIKELYDLDKNFNVSSDNRTCDNKVLNPVRDSSGQHIIKDASYGMSSFKSSKVFLMKKNVDIYELSTKNGLKIKATLEHKFLTNNGWTKLSDIKSGEDICIQSGLGVFSENKNITGFILKKRTFAMEQKYKRFCLNFPTKWSKELGQILGWLIGDGYIDKKCGYPSLVIGNKDEELIDYFIKILEEWFPNRVKLSTSSNCPHIIVRDSRAGEFFKFLGVTIKKSFEKTVPKSLWSAPKEAIVGFLQGLFSADGSVNVNTKQKGSTIKLSITSKKLLEEVKVLLLNLGINGNFYIRRKEGHSLLPSGNRKVYKEYPTKTIWEISIGKANRHIFYKEIGFLQGWKNNVLYEVCRDVFPYRELFIDKVVDIKFYGIDDVYDITVDKSHSFIANGIVTHNCSEIVLPTSKDRTAVCCLGSVNLERLDEWKDDPDMFDTILRALDNILQSFIDKADTEKYSKSIYSAKSERSIGLGVMGYHGMLMKNGVPFETIQSRSLNRIIFKDINEKAVAASIKLAEERGVCPDAEGTNFKQRHSYIMAIAPTANISVIAGSATPCIELIASNAYLQKTLSGSFLVKNKYLVRRLEVLGKNITKVWKSIIKHNGSVQHLDFFSEEDKQVFKTAYEINQREVIEQAGNRQQYICQAQSVNLFFNVPVHMSYLYDVHIKAWQAGVKSLYYLRSDSILKADSVEREAIRNKIEFEECAVCQ